MRPHGSDGMACVLLAGGKSRRLGRDKVREELGGESLLARAIRTLAPLCLEVIVVTAPGEGAHLASGPRVRAATDRYLGRGPIAGLHAGLSAARSFRSFVAASDMPFLNASLIRYMMEISGPYDIVIPRRHGLLEPLHAVYSKRCLRPLEAALEAGENRIAAFFPLVSVRCVEDEEIERFDRSGLCFFNVNTEADLERARAELDRGP